MKKILSKSTLYAIMTFACLNVFMLTSCGDEAEKTTETTTTETTTTTVPAEAAPVVESAAPKDSVAVKAAEPSATMDSANTKPVSAPVKK